VSKWCVVLPATLNHQTALPHQHGSQPTANRLPLPQRSGGLYVSPVEWPITALACRHYQYKTHACSPGGTTWRHCYGLAYWEMEDGQCAIIPPPFVTQCTSIKSWTFDNCHLGQQPPGQRPSREDCRPKQLPPLYSPHGREAYFCHLDTSTA